jgi:hypothetical protein
MAFLRAVDLLRGIMGNAINISVTIDTLDPAVRSAAKQLFIDIEKAKLTLFIDSAQATMLVAHQAVQILIRENANGISQQQHC